MAAGSKVAKGEVQSEYERAPVAAFQMPELRSPLPGRTD
jgi:hypothetical protein